MSGDDIIFTISAAAGVTVDITSVQGSISAINGDIITFVDGNLIHSIDFSITMTAVYLTANNDCITDLDPDHVITFTVPRSRHPFAVDDVFTLDQTESRELTPLERGSNDSDPNNLSLSIKTLNHTPITGGEQTIAILNGLITIDNENKIWFKPDDSFTGLIQFPYEIINTDRYQDDGVIFVTVDPLSNQSTIPTAVNDSYSMDQGTTLFLIPLTKGINDSDPNGLVLTISKINEDPLLGGAQTIEIGTVGDVFIDAAGVIRFTPDAAYFGTVIFSYEITNTNGYTHMGLQTITIDAVAGDEEGESESGPTAVNDVYSMDEDTSLILRPLFKGINDSDANDSDLSIVSINGSALVVGTPIEVQDVGMFVVGNVSIDVAGVITFTPVPNYFGTVTFPYVISNENGQEDEGTQTIIIDDVAEDQDGGDPESGPTAVDDVYSMDEDTSLILRPLFKGINDSDANNSALHIFSIDGHTLDNSPSQVFDVYTDVNELEGNVSIVGGVITFTPKANYNGTVTFPYVVKNAEGLTDQGTQTIVIYDVAEDEDGGDPESGPTAVDDVYKMDEDTSLILRPLFKGINDSDANDSALHIFSINEEELTGGGVEQTISIGSPVIGNIVIDVAGVITFTPVANYNGTVSFLYVVENAEGLQDEGTQTIIIDDVAEDQDGGDPESGPTAVDDLYSMDEDTSLILRPLFKGINDSDENDSALHIFSINEVELTGGGVEQTIPVYELTEVVGNIVIDAAGVIIFTPVANHNGTVSFLYVVENAEGLQDEGTQTIIIYDVAEDQDGGDPESGPTAVDDFYSMDEDTSLILRPLFKGINDSDANNSALHIFSIDGHTLDNSPSQVFDVYTDANELEGNVLIEGGVITFTPKANYNGTVSFPYVVKNAEGLTDQGTQTIIIYDVAEDQDGGDPESGPTAVDDVYSMDEDTSLILRPLFKGINDSDENDSALHIFSINEVELTGGSVEQTIPVYELTEVVGNIVIDAAGVIIFTPVANHNGTVSFLYVVENAEGLQDEGTQTIIIYDVAEDQDGGDPESGPTAVDDFYSMDEDTSLILRPLKKGINDSDANDLALHIESINGISLGDGSVEQTILIAAIGEVVIDGGVITFTPLPDLNGTKSFNYVVSNSDDDLATGLQTIIIAPVDEVDTNPTAVDDFYQTEVDESIIIDPLTRGTNDSDPNGDVLTITHFDGDDILGGVQQITVANGKLDINGSGIITFTPDAGYVGSVTFTYQITDGNGGTAIGNVSISVIASSSKNEIKVSNTVKNRFTVYPNPSFGNVNVTLKSNVSEDVSVILTDITGRVIDFTP